MRATTRPRRTTAVTRRSLKLSSIRAALVSGLLEVFFQVHRADLDEGVVGSIYRSEIFYTSEEQRTVAEEMIRDVDASGHWLGKTVTKISPARCVLGGGAGTSELPATFPERLQTPFPGRTTTPRTSSGCLAVDGCLTRLSESGTVRSRPNAHAAGCVAAIRCCRCPDGTVMPMSGRPTRAAQRTASSTRSRRTRGPGA